MIVIGETQAVLTAKAGACFKSSGFAHERGLIELAFGR
jgi:hypothetical protein